MTVLPLKDKARKKGRPKRDPAVGWPKRPLSAYNIFFKHERKRLLLLRNEERTRNRKINPTSLHNDCQEKDPKILSNLVKTIGSNWKKLGEDERTFYQKASEVYKIKFKEEMKIFNKKAGI